VAISILADPLFVILTHGSTGDLIVDNLDYSPSLESTNTLSLLTINMAHGRSNGRHQIWLSNDTIGENINNIGYLILREKPHIVALQEADDKSWWSGRFSHVKKVGQLGGMRYAISGTNVDGLGLHYGAAIVTQLEVSNCKQVTFAKSIPTLSKGFVIASFQWPNEPKYLFDVVSLHLDFASAAVRTSQLETLTKILQLSDRPMIIMGDFNTDMQQDLLLPFANNLKLSTYDIHNKDIVTFKGLNTRIDWIFVSDAFEIITHEVLDDIISDHQAVSVEVRRK